MPARIRGIFDMESNMKQSFLTGVAIILFATALGYGSNAHAGSLPKPSYACTENNEGEFATTVRIARSLVTGAVLYVDHATWVCSSNEWVLADVTRCFTANGNCAPL
jgi:hypothetical protein